MKHKANRMGVSDSKSEEVWYVDSGASNHMTNHKEWFSVLEKLKKLMVVETKDDTPHPIEHIRDVPLSHVGQNGIMRNILHVPTITKNLVSVSQIVDQRMQVRFTHHRCFIEEEGRIIAQGRRDGRMFILETNDVGTAMFAKGQKVKLDIDLWHKWISHINFRKLQEMQSKHVVSRLPKFSGQKARFVKRASSVSNIGFHSPMRRIRAGIGSLLSIRMCGDWHKM